MDVTEVRIKLMDEQLGGNERLQAFCSVTLDGEFVVRDVKVIEGAQRLFVAMPSRRIADHCPHCRTKNHLRARYCNHCGRRLDENRAAREEGPRVRLHADVAHPINSQCRERVMRAVLAEYEAELARSKEPGYVSRYDDPDWAPQRDRAPFPDGRDR